MGRTTIFNGIELVVPDAYSALDVSRLLTPTSGGVGIIALIGESDGGAPGLHLFGGGTSSAVVKRELKSGPGADASRLALRSGTDGLVQAGASTVLFFKTNNSTPSTLTLGGTSPAVAEEFDVLINNPASFFDVAGDAKSFDTPGSVDTFWFNVTNGANTQNAPTGALGTPRQIDILAADDAAAIAGKLQVVADALGAYNATVSTATVSFVLTAAGAQTPDAVDVDSGATITTTTQGADADTIGPAKLTTKQFGAFTALFTGDIASVGSGKIITVRDENGVPEISQTFGLTKYLSVTYTGDGSAATLTLEYTGSVLRLKTTLTGQSDGSENIDIDATLLTIGQLVDAINLLIGYTAVVLFTNQQFKVVDLDLVLTAGAVDIKGPALFEAVASIKEAIDFGNSQSQLYTVERGALNDGDTLPTSFPTTAFAGGTKGSTANSDVQAGFNELLKLRVNIAVPLFSSDNQGGSTIVIEAINSQLKDHVTNRSSILGRSEAQSYASIKGNKDAFKAEAARLNSRLVALVSQSINDLDIDGNLIDFDEWGLAVVGAQTQAGSPIGTPLTFKQLPISGITQDVSWNPIEDSGELIKAGTLIAGADENNVLRFINGYTTSLADDNNANIFIETVESLAIFAFNHRKFMKSRFLGKSAFGRQDVLGAIVESQRFELNDTKSIKGFDESLTKIFQASAGILRYELAVEPFEGIIFILPTIVAVRET